MRVRRISDHAILRWIDRVENIGIDGLRMRMGFGKHDDPAVIEYLETVLNWDIRQMKDDLRKIINHFDPPLNGRFLIEGVSFVIAEGTVVTIIK